MLKRLFDIVASALGLLALGPLLLLIALVIKLDSRGPVLFLQERVGRGGKSFWIRKFRTMRVDAEKHGGQLTVGRDPRVTRVGRFLRQWKLDELPQLINVLVGDMSVVGPRPEVPRYVALYDERQKRVLEVRPGITDLASIEFRDENALLEGVQDPEGFYLREVMPRKLELNLSYIDRHSLWLDIRIIAATLLRVAAPSSQPGALTHRNGADA